jgi:hypothetical protein
MSGYTKGFTREHLISPAELGLNGVVVANGAPVTSSTFDATGYNQLRLDFSLTRVAATVLTFYLDHSRDGGSTWERLKTSSIAAGTETLSDHLVSLAVAGSVNFPYLTSIFYKKMRLVITTTNGTTDTVTVGVAVGIGA